MSEDKSLVSKLNNLLLVIHKKFQFPKENRIDYKKDRIMVSELIVNVLLNKISVKNALLKFPKENNDISLKIVWHALMHFEADEDFSNSDIEFKEIQIDFLETLSDILKTGKELPQNLLAEYEEFHKNIEYSSDDTKKEFLQNLKRNLFF